MLFKTKSYQLLIICFLFPMNYACNSLEITGEQLIITPRSSMPTSRAAASAFIINEKAYVLSGRKSSRGDYLSDFWEYTPENDKWKKLPDLPFKGRVQGIAEVVNGKAYAGLGYNGAVYNEDSYLRDFWMYNPADSSWIQKADFPSNQTSAGVAFVYKNYIYVSFGFYSGFTSDVFRYDTENDTWVECKKANVWSRGGAEGCECNNRYFLGMGYKTYMPEDWYEFFPERETWEERAKVPQKGRIFHSTLARNNEILILGGRFFGGTETREEFYEEILAYNIDTDKWALRGHLPNGGRENMVTFTVNGKCYFGLGENAEGEILNDLYCIE